MLEVDVAIIGGGFGGSLMSLVLQRAGLRVALLDRGQHPRFAIGESSTPIANLVLSDLCREYNLSNIAPLAKYGTWQASHPELGCGIKRGFSYFHHRAGEPFVADDEHSTELLVAASSSDQHADTHWLRQDVDAFLFQEARVSGVFCIENCHLNELTLKEHDVELATSTDCVIRTRFVVDASGDGGFLARKLNIADRTHEMRTSSRAVFAHFAGVSRWTDRLTANDINVTDHPFDCDNAALHHVFDGGWMWQLRFNDETVSAGFVQNLSTVDSQAIRLSAEAEWQTWLDRFPSIAEQFAHATVVRPESGLRSSGRLQRKWANAAGSWWAMLPNTAGFVDPLHSTGIAHTLCGIERLARVLIESLERDDLKARLQAYDRCVLAELELMDLLVSGCFAAMHDLRKFAAMSMLYFVVATSYERSRLLRLTGDRPAFLLADNPAIRIMAREQCDRLPHATNSEQFVTELADAVRPFNLVGLCDPALRNMYRRSALPE